MSFIRSTSVTTSTALTVPNIQENALTEGKVVRVSGENTVAVASNTDSAVQLNTVLIRKNNVYYSAGVISGFSSLSPGSPYFLGTNGAITSTPPTPTSMTRVLYLGFALNTTDLLFRPGTPISGV